LSQPHGTPQVATEHVEGTQMLTTVNNERNSEHTSLQMINILTLASIVHESSHEWTLARRRPLKCQQTNGAAMTAAISSITWVFNCKYKQ
jgi:hypothetical protein